MSNLVEIKNENTQLKTFFDKPDIKSKFNELLGKNSTSFITSVIQIVNSNEMLKDADPTSVYTAAATAAALNLPLNNSLGLAYILPYKGKDAVKAQFQIGYKAYIQLAQRSGQFKTINVSDVKEGEILKENMLTGEIDFNWIERSKRINLKTIGYVAYFQLLNGFSHTLYMSVEELTAHGKQYSQTFKKGFGLWADNFDSMARKTVIKLLLSKYAPLSVDMQNAIVADGSVIKNVDSQYLEVDEYIDNPQEAPKSKLEITLEKEGRKIEVEEAEALDQVVLDTIEGFTTQEEVKAFYDSLSAEDKKTYKAIITKKGVSLMTKK
jgi:recombination protein RecT